MIEVLDFVVFSNLRVLVDDVFMISGCKVVYL